MKENKISTDIIVSCPHCNELILIEKLNCCIFRHGAFKITGKQIHAHASRDLCEFYIKNNLIYGCGNPFKIICHNNTDTNSNPEFSTVVCDYI